MKEKLLNWKVVLFAIFFLGALLRFYRLGDVPLVLNRDELSEAYNAYSIVETGKDEHGVEYPFVFMSFGDYKPPVYIYMLAGVFKIFGISDFNVRVLNGVFGSLMISLAFFLVREIFYTYSRKFKDRVGLMCAGLLMIAPWHFYYSRMLYESLVALFFSLSGLLFLFVARRRVSYFVLSLVFFVLGMISYNPPIFILPLLVPLVVVVFGKDYFKKKIKFATILFLVSFYCCYFGYLFLSMSLIVGRSEATIFYKPYIETQQAFIRDGGIEVPFESLLLREKPYITYKFISNYLASFRKDFLFFGGDYHLWHGIRFGGGKVGNLNILFLPFLILGVLYILRSKKKELYFLVGWILITPIACSLTQTAPATTRLLMFLFLLVLISAIGMYYLIELMKGRSKILVLVIWLCLMAMFGYYLKIYFGRYNERLCDFSYKEMNICGMKEIADFISENNSYDKIIFLADDGSEEHYIQMAYYLGFNPGDFQKEAVWDKDGFDYVSKYKNYYFLTYESDRKLDRLKSLAKSGNNLYVLRVKPEYRKSLIGGRGVVKKEILRVKDYNNRVLWFIGE